MDSVDAIYIIGAGAIGKALAVFLKLEGKNVILLRGSVDDGSDHIEKITVELNNNTEVEAAVRISSISHFSLLDGIVVLTNKSYGNYDLAGKLKGKTGASPIVFLQNGLNVEQPFCDLNFPAIFRTVLFATSQYISPDKLRFKPVAASPVGIIRGKTANLAIVVQQLNNRFFQFRAEPNIQPVIWTKAIINSVFNSVCPMLETDNGIFYREERALAIAKNIIAEGIAVAAAKGIALEANKVVDSLLLISRSSDGQLISTLQDINNKRRTEIETLNFAIVEIANELNMPNAVAVTRLLGELVYIKSGLTRNH